MSLTFSSSLVASAAVPSFNIFTATVYSISSPSGLQYPLWTVPNAPLPNTSSSLRLSSAITINWLRLGATFGCGSIWWEGGEGVEERTGKKIGLALINL